MYQASQSRITDLGLLNYEITHMESCNNQKSVKQIKIILYLRLFKVACLCLDESFAYSWYSLNQLHEIVTWNSIQLKGVPC